MALGLAGAISLPASAQEGWVCETPITVTTLPYTHTDNTINYGNDYTSADAPPFSPDVVGTGTGTTNYLNGYDVVYAYTPSINQSITVRADGTSTWVGLWAFTGCPFTETVGYHTATGGGDMEIANLPVQAGTTYYFVLGTWPDPESTAYVFSITTDAPTADCTELPSPGATQGPSSLCPGVVGTYTLDNAPTLNGQSYLWQTSGDGNNWSDAIGDNTGTSYVGSFIAGTWLRCQVTCGVAGSAYSTPLQITMLPATECYCEPTITTIEPICHVSFADISNDSPGDVGGAPAVEDFSHIVAHVAPGGSYTLSASGNTAGNYTCHIVTFFDWDLDGTYETSVNLGSITDDVCTEIISTTVDVPADAATGTSRMMLVKTYNSPASDPCDSYLWGQAEVYSVQVGEDVGVYEASAAKGWAVHPNPATTELFITAPDGNRAQVRVYGMLGQLVMESGPTQRLDVANLAPGTYNLVLLDGQGNIQGRTRFVKQ